MADGNYLLDTHTLIWWWLGDSMLSARARSLLEAKSGAARVSAVSGIEIALKVAAGRLPALVEPLREFDTAVTDDGFRHLPITFDHAIKAGLMKSPHRDPFDRLIAAQALSEDLTVITRDRQIVEFGCKTLW